MKIISLMYADWIREEELASHQNSDRIWVPSHMFQRWLLEETEGSVVIAELEGIGVCMYGPHRGSSNAIYAPDWICQALHVSGEPEEDGEDFIVPIRAKPNQCTFVKLQPLTSTHIDLVHQTQTPAEDVLARGFENYTCIQKGKIMCLQLESGDTLDVEVLETVPDTEGILCIRAGEIELELLPPPGAEVAEPESEHEPESYLEPVAEPVPEPITETREERRAKLAAAALARFSKLAE